MNNSVYDFVLTDLNGKPFRIADYKGKVMLIVNIASKCGLSVQLNGLQKTYLRFKDRGFVILAFPSNDFAGQEPLDGAAIQHFCTSNYGVSFPIMHKGKVRGAAAQPIYQFLAEKAKVFGMKKNYPLWNFQKYLIDKKGRVVDYFVPVRDPESDKITEAIEKCLKE